MKTNLNELAKTITLAEGGKVNLTIAQVKEVLSITLKFLAGFPDSEILKIINRYR